MNFIINFDVFIYKHIFIIIWKASKIHNLNCDKKGPLFQKSIEFVFKYKKKTSHYFI